MRGRQAWRGRQPSLAGAAIEQNIKPGGNAVHVAHGRGHQAQGHDDTLQLDHCHAAKIDHLGLGPAYQAAGRHGINDDLPEEAIRRRPLQAAQVDAIKVGLAPEGGLGIQLGVQGGVAERGDVDAAERWEHAAARLEQGVPGPDVRLQHALVQQQRAHGLAYQHVGAPRRQPGRLYARAHHTDACADARVGRAQCGGVVRHVGCLHRVHPAGAGLGGKQGQDARPGADVDDCLAGKVGLEGTVVWRKGRGGDLGGW